MDIDNDPILSGKEFLFCEDGNRLALAFLETSRNAVRLADVAEKEALRELVCDALADYLDHRYSCDACATTSYQPAPPRPQLEDETIH